jgi:mRNA-degrading endonuclease RelE of RelBE toxin-antitoxin system
MKINISKSANKFLESLDENNRNSILAKIKILKICLETQKIYPPEELDIKKLKGNLKGFSRIRIGKIRVIFSIDIEANEILIYDINYRSKIYNN